MVDFFKRFLPKLKPIAGKLGKQLVQKLPGMVMASDKKAFAKKTAVEMGKGIYSDLLKSSVGGQATPKRRTPKRTPKRRLTKRGGYRMRRR